MTLQNIYIIAIGSNYQKKENIRRATEKLNTLFQELTYSSFIETKPVNMPNNLTFTNGLVEIKSDLSPEKLKCVLKEIEKDLGRNTEKQNNGIIPIDMDIIMWNDTIMSNDIERSYIKTLLNELEHR